MVEEDKKGGNLAAQTEKILEQLHYEVNFASKAFGIKTTEFNDTLQGAMAEINLLITKFNSIVKQSEGQNRKITEELTTFALLPEKITDNIKNIVPQIAEEVEKIHSHHVIEVKDQFTSLHQQLANVVSDYAGKLENLANKSLDSLSEASEKFTATIEQKLTQYSNQLAHEADTVSSQKSMRFLKNLAFIVLFSGLVSAFSSYLVATQFPRYVRVDSPNNLSINDSKIEIWGARVNELEESKLDKKINR